MYHKHTQNLYTLPQSSPPISTQPTKISLSAPPRSSFCHYRNRSACGDKSKAIFCCIRSVTHFTDNLHCNFTIECLEDNRDILRCLHRVFSYVETVFHFHNLYKKEVNLQKLFVCFLSYQNTFLLCISQQQSPFLYSYFYISDYNTNEKVIPPRLCKRYHFLCRIIIYYFVTIL